MSLLPIMQTWSSFSWWPGSPVLHRVECQVASWFLLCTIALGRIHNIKTVVLRGWASLSTHAFNAYNQSLQTFIINIGFLQWKSYMCLFFCLLALFWISLFLIWWMAPCCHSTTPIGSSTIGDNQASSSCSPQLQYGPCRFGKGAVPGPIRAEHHSLDAPDSHTSPFQRAVQLCVWVPVCVRAHVSIK